MKMAALKIFLTAVFLCSLSGRAFSCSGLHFISNTPVITFQPGNTYSVNYEFDHDNPGGTYSCFVRDSERSCPPVTNQTTCDEMQSITFSNLDPGVWFTCGVRCRFGNVLRTIARSFATPSQEDDCNTMLINDGISFFNYTSEGNATTCFMWSSTGSPTGFQCSIDAGANFTCESPHYEVLSPDQHTIKIIPEGCTGNITRLQRRFEVPAEGCGGVSLSFVG